MHRQLADTAGKLRAETSAALARQQQAWRAELAAERERQRAELAKRAERTSAGGNGPRRGRRRPG